MKRMEFIMVKVQIVAAPRVISGTSASGNAYSMTICQAIVFFENEEPQVCELILPRDHQPVGLGAYEAVFGPYVDNRTKRLGGQLLALRPLK